MAQLNFVRVGTKLGGIKISKFSKLKITSTGFEMVDCYNT